MLSIDTNFAHAVAIRPLTIRHELIDVIKLIRVPDRKAFFELTLGDSDINNAWRTLCILNTVQAYGSVFAVCNIQNSG